MPCDGAGRAVVTCTIRNARPVTSKFLFALVDVEILVDGVAFVICGVQARRGSFNTVAVNLPTYKAADGSWQPAVEVPPELGTPLAKAVLDFLIEEGLA